MILNLNFKAFSAAVTTFNIINKILNVNLTRARTSNSENFKQLNSLIFNNNAQLSENFNSLIKTDYLFFK